MKGMTLGSLFDGSGGFPLAGAMNGMTPVWASEIEPYPLRVTAARFPGMKQLGDVTRIDGASIDPVDVITFGSPCQDLSVAGKQTGIHDGKRSSLFFEAVRIIREMRGATNGKYPRFAVWENVPGAFSSNKGADFRAVLQALCEVGGEAVPVPEPPKGKWAKAGCVVGDGYSIAWRVYDAQYWGVPQRRKRIYLVADFGSERAGEILFEREGVRGDTAQGGEAREGAAEDAEGSAGGSDRVKCLTPWDCQSKRIYLPDGVYPKLAAMDCGGANNQAVIYEPVVYDCRGNGDGCTVPNLTGDHENRVTDYTSVCVGNGQMHQTELCDRTGALNCMHDQQAIIHNAKPPRRYIVRRLTPLECCRLQGFPDWWEDGANGSDSARYKMWGNGIALPCAADVMRRIAEECEICTTLHNVALDLHSKPVVTL